MSNKTKKIGMWSLKALAIGLFVLLAVFNMQVISGNSTVAGIDFSDIFISTSMLSSVAESNYEDNNKYIWFLTCTYLGNGTYLKECKSGGSKRCVCPDPDK